MSAEKIEDIYDIMISTKRQVAKLCIQDDLSCA